MTSLESNSMFSKSSVVSSSGSASLAICWAEQDLVLFAERALFWPRARTLIIADPHFGKAAAFRARGVPVPAGTTQHNLNRLTALLAATSAARLIVLGDFFHARLGLTHDTLQAIQRWRTQHAPLHITLIRGNHDCAAGDPPGEWNITCADEPMVEEPFTFRHEPSKKPSGFTLAGHIHPGAVLRDHDRASFRLPCFHFSAHQAILPAFGAFTGLHPVRPRSGDRIMVVWQGAIVEVPGVHRPSRKKKRRAFARRRKNEA